MSTTTLTRARTGTAAKLGIAGIATFFTTSIAVAAVTPGYRSTRDAISALAAMDSPYAYVMIGGFLAAAAGLVATGIAVRQRYGARLAAVLLIVSGALMATAGLARQDCSEALESCIDHGEAPLASTHFWVHQYVSLALFLTLVVTSFVLIRAVRRTPGFGYLTGPARIVAWTGLVVTVLAMTIGFGAVNGLVQRPYLALLFGWPTLLAAIAPRR
ncbi:DUF998 domain-containing protein [Actinoplanes sp. NPDC051633]|uniref:DUF998 domain-containing protein n=1 Tax=Actinoplanes sp. NPDC051633 TaxID=3155670 RepID=UPI003424E39C